MRENTMDYEALLNEILNIGTELTRAGAECFRVEDTLYRICRAYDDVEYCDFFCIQSNIQATIKTKDQKHYTQIRHIRQGSNNFDRLDYLNNLSRKICKEKPGPEEIHVLFDEVMHRKVPDFRYKLLSSVLAELGFALISGCNLLEILVVLLVTMLIMVGVGEWILKREQNKFVYNFILCLLSALTISILERIGLPVRVDRIILSLIFYVISGIGITHCISDMINGDIISGFLNLMNAVVGAVAIASGIFLGLMIRNSLLVSVVFVSPHEEIQILGAGIGALGFALVYNTSIRQAISCGFGGVIMFTGYILATHYGCSNFLATMISAAITGLFAFVMARYHKAPSTIFLTSTILPTIPGARLFYAMHAVVRSNMKLARSETYELLSLCFAIQLGFMLADISLRYISNEIKRKKHRENESK